MTNAVKRRILGWGLVAGVFIFFAMSLWFGGSAQMFFAMFAFAHLVLIAVPFRGVFYSWGQLRIVGLGWLACIFSAVLWEVCYHNLYRRFQWSQPDLPGEIIVSLPLGWIPATVLIFIAGGVKAILDKKWPLENQRVVTAVPADIDSGDFSERYYSRRNSEGSD